MQFKVWFTKARNNDGTAGVRKTDEVWIETQDGFMEFVDVACLKIFGRCVVPEIRASDFNDNNLPTSLRGSCPVRLTVNGPSKDINRRRHLVATEVVFHWEVDWSALSHMSGWLDDDNNDNNTGREPASEAVQS